MMKALAANHKDPKRSRCQRKTPKQRANHPPRTATQQRRDRRDQVKGSISHYLRGAVQ